MFKLNKQQPFNATNEGAQSCSDKLKILFRNFMKIFCSNLESFSQNIFSKLCAENILNQLLTVSRNIKAKTISRNTNKRVIFPWILNANLL